jgi:hypothetical protein
MIEDDRAAEMRRLLGFARGIGLDEVRKAEIADLRGCDVGALAARMPAG